MIISTVFSQSNYWPVELALPDSVASDSASDSPIKVSSELNASDIFKSKNYISFYKKNNSYLVQQNLHYLVTNYNNGIQNHYIDLSGKYIKSSLVGGWGDLGLDWTPGLYYYKSKSSGVIQVPVDLGPVLHLSVASIPMEIRGGLSAYGWNNDFNRVSGLSMSTYRAEPGYYGGINIGDTLLRWFGLPVVTNVSVLGKSIGSTSLGVIKSSLKTQWGSASEDSIYFVIGDSLSNGKVLYGSGSNSTLYSTTPWKVEHNLSLTGAIRGKERFLIRPAVLYSYSIKNIKYPTQPDLLDNVRTRKNNLVFQAATGEDALIAYSGGISFAWNNTDMLYNEDVTKINSDAKKQSANLNDCDEYTALTDHDLLLSLPHGFSLNYQLHASKNSEMYPYSYTLSGEVKTNSNENDRVRILNHGGLLYNNTDTTGIELYGEYTQDLHYYYKKKRSGESQTSDKQKVGCNLNFNFWNLRLGENVFAEAEKSDYKFKNVHKGDLFDPPPYSRNVSSLMIVSWSINEQWTLTGKWNETYYDNGKWYGKAYSDTLIVIDKEKYAIENKSIDYSIQLLTDYRVGNAQFQVGYLFRDSYYRFFNNDKNSYMVGNAGKGYIMEPSLAFTYGISKAVVAAKVVRKINTLDESCWKIDKNWDLSLNLNTVF